MGAPCRAGVLRFQDVGFACLVTANRVDMRCWFVDPMTLLIEFMLATFSSP